MDPNSARVNRTKGDVHAFKGEADKEYESKKRALEINPNESVNIFWGGVLGTRGLHHQRIDFATKAIELDPLEPLNYAARGSANRTIGNFDQATIDFQKALEIESDNSHALNRFARL